jgi:hypothetical protein
MKKLMLIIPLFFLFGCSDVEEEPDLLTPDFDLTGEWDGEMTGFPDAYYFDITIEQSGNYLDGYYINDNDDEMEVSGTVSGNHITIILDSFDYPDYRATCTGTFTEFFASGTWHDTEGYYGSWETSKQ